MGHNRRMRILFGLLPFKSWQYALLHRHIFKCEVCLKDVADIEEARKATIAKENLGEGRDFWRQFLLDLEKEKPKKRTGFQPFWRWAAGTAGVLGIAAATIILLNSPGKNGIADLTVKLRVGEVKIYEEPAQAFIYQTQDPDTTYVWVEKQDKGEVH